MTRACLGLEWQSSSGRAGRAWVQGGERGGRGASVGSGFTCCIEVYYCSTADSCSILPIGRVCPSVVTPLCVTHKHLHSVPRLNPALTVERGAHPLRWWQSIKTPIWGKKRASCSLFVFENFVPPALYFPLFSRSVWFKWLSENIFFLWILGRRRKG